MAYYHKNIGLTFLAAMLLACAGNTIKERTMDTLSESADMCAGLIDLAQHIETAKKVEEKARTTAKAASEGREAATAWEAARRSWADAEDLYGAVRARYLRRASARQLQGVTDEVMRLAEKRCDWPLQRPENQVVTALSGASDPSSASKPAPPN